MSRNQIANRSPKLTALIAGLAMSSMLISGCSKPPPPPPPPPPAPVEPPPPADVSMDTVIQDARVDPRVQAASGMVIAEDRVSLATAVAKLADALARGDEKAMAAMLTPKARSVLDTLTQSGEWSEATKDIEAVRIVLIRSGVDLSGMSATAPLDITKILAEVPESSREEVQQMFAQGSAANWKALWEKMLENADNPDYTQGLTPEMIETQKKNLTERLAALNAAEDSRSTGTGVLLAVQDPRGAYLLGWGAEQNGDSWVFGNAPAMAEQRARASSFDGIGIEGFQEVQLASAPPIVAPPPEMDPEGSGSGGSGGGETPSGPSSPRSPSTPGRKNTPAGPVTVPGGG